MWARDNIPLIQLRSSFCGEAAFYEESDERFAERHTLSSARAK
jgi:hypothetical protein